MSLTVNSQDYALMISLDSVRNFLTEEVPDDFFVFYLEIVNLWLFIASGWDQIVRKVDDDREPLNVITIFCVIRFSCYLYRFLCETLEHKKIFGQCACVCIVLILGNCDIICFVKMINFKDMITRAV